MDATFNLDPTLARTLAGSAFRRADTLRDERGAERGHRVEQFLRSLQGWLPPGLERLADISAFNAAIAKEAEAMRESPDAAVAARFHEELGALKKSGVGLKDSQRVAAVFACIGEASRRTLGMWPHPVQFTGARVLLSGRLAEMQTGEGKSLVAALAATAMAGSGAVVHIISTNDYLARRDSEEMQPLFAFFGLNSAFIEGEMEPDERRISYRHAICYVSGKELVFDYLKDQLAGHGTLPMRVTQVRQLWASGAAGVGPSEPLIPALHFAIVDEADSVLIDEARTPMIISRESPGLYETELLKWAITAAGTLERGRHFKITGARDIELLPGALDACPSLPAEVRAVWRSPPWRSLVLRQALTAWHLFIKDQHYILAEGKVQIVDESTGRVMADRSWEQGLHQLIEAKEGLEITQGRETLARMTFQRFFRRYFLLAGLTGTAAEASRELWSVYRLQIRRVPPNRVVQRRRLPDRCTVTTEEKWQAVAQDAYAAAARGQPVLIGTRSVEASEQIGAELAQRGIAHVVLNARQDSDEARIVSEAGRAGCITVATNMAGRGTDIKLSPEARAAGGLHVILTEFHESPRVDRQLFGRSGRQGDAGSVCALVCAQDTLFKPLPGWWRWAMVLKPHVLRSAVRWTQWRAERRAYQGRMQTLRQDRELSRLIGFAGNVK
ncbi:MAG: preprotein translocase subunit SecA [Azonexus sp.]|jgi:preprotein translocase subunit SecA|uniref:preprotein translocase subunit SecA n=1 Tax=Azonexus sp. TaxID=1872668 RepID=UPI002828C54F|nr:preprotein translocase subunit SecA [Azonexus sp.]MDR0777345.1 preprotein translocase subunit SecA [Azonexus sp.]